MKQFLIRIPVVSAVLITVADIVIALVIGLAVTPLVPPVPRLPDFIALCVLAVATAILVTVLGWWREVGCNRPAEWRDLWLLLLPAVLAFLPLARGFKALDAGSVVYLLAGYLLTGFFEETLFLLRRMQRRESWVDASTTAAPEVRTRPVKATDASGQG